MPFCGLLPNFAPSAEAKHVAKKTVIISYVLPGCPMQSFGMKQPFVNGCFRFQQNHSEGT